MKRIFKRLLTFVCVLTLFSSLTTTFAATKFTDVPSSYWAYDEINFIVDKGLFNGTTATTFSPEAQMKRGQLAAVLYRYAGEPKVKNTSSYSDVSASMYYANACAWAKENDIFMADKLNATKLNPDEGITRSEFAVMLYNFAKLNGVAEVDRNAKNPFTDMKDVSDELKPALVNWAVPAGVLNGTSSTTMSPFAAIKRSHVAAMLYRYETEVANPDSSTGTGTNTGTNNGNNTSTGTQTGTYTAGDTLVLKKGGSYKVNIGVGEKVRVDDQLSAVEGWTSWDDNKFVNGSRVATFSWWDSAETVMAIEGLAESTVTLQILSMNDYKTVLATIDVTVTAASTGNSGSGNSGSTSNTSGGLTEQDVYDAIIALKSEYSEGMTWTNDNVYDTPAKTYRGCAAFGAICAEAAFGTPAGKRVNGYEGARVGDRIRFNDHTVVVLEAYDDHYVIAHGNYNGKTSWEDNLPKSTLAVASGVYIETNWQ